MACFCAFVHAVLGAYVLKNVVAAASAASTAGVVDVPARTFSRAAMY